MYCTYQPSGNTGMLVPMPTETCWNLVVVCCFPLLAPSWWEVSTPVASRQRSVSRKKQSTKHPTKTNQAQQSLCLFFSSFTTSLLVSNISARFAKSILRSCGNALRVIYSACKLLVATSLFLGQHDVGTTHGHQRECVCVHRRPISSNVRTPGSACWCCGLGRVGPRWVVPSFRWSFGDFGAGETPRPTFEGPLVDK